jgi:hypothetical protein
MTATNSASDATFITKVRRAIRDLPAFQNEKLPTDGTTGGPTAGAKPFRLTHQPIAASSVNLTAPGGVPSSYRAAILGDVPAGYWRAGEASGDLADSSGNARTAVLSGASTYGQAGALVNSTDLAVKSVAGSFFNAPAAAIDISNLNPFTFEAWIKPGTVDGTTRRQVGIEVPVNAGANFNITNVGVTFRRSDAAGGVDAIGGPIPVVGVWTHYVGTYDGTTMHFYVNGVESGTGLATSRLCGSAAGNFQIGASGGTNNNGDSTFDEVAIYPVALSAAQVLSHYQMGTITPRRTPGWTVDYNDAVLPPVANHVNVNTDTGELFFSAAPPALGTLAVSYQSTRFTDDQVLDALLEGMNNLWPEIWNPVTDTTTLSIISPIQFEYALNAIFGDQRTIILDVEYSPPGGFNRFSRTSMWRQTLDIVSPMLIFAKLPPIASTVRLTYTQTFQSLGDMPTQMQHLAKYYAIGFLMALGETMRTRADDLGALTAENSNPPGTSLQAAAWWLQQYDVQLKRFGMTEPTRMTVRNRTVERLGLSSFWNDDS